VKHFFIYLKKKFKYNINPKCDKNKKVKMETQSKIYEAIITKHSLSNDVYYGTYVLFQLTPESEQLEGFIIRNNTHLSNKQHKQMLNNQIPKHFKVGKKLKVIIVNTDSRYYDLCVV
jgi:hypothetical protein